MKTNKYEEIYNEIEREIEIEETLNKSSSFMNFLFPNLYTNTQKDEMRVFVQALERKLCEDGMQGDNKTRLQILQYFQQKEKAENQAKEAEQHKPVLIGDQLFSLVTTVLSLSIVGGALGLCIGMFMNFTCEGSNSQSCQDVRYLTENFTNYFADKPDSQH